MSSTAEISFSLNDLSPEMLAQFQQRLQRLQDLATRRSTVALKIGKVPDLLVPDSLVKLLLQALQQAAAGKKVVLMEADAEISPEKAAIYNGLLNPQKAAASQRYLAEKDPRKYSMLRTSVVPTMLKAGVGPNVIPSEAEATLDIRALPDENIEKFYADMKRVIGDPAVEIAPMPMTLAVPMRPRESSPKTIGCIITLSSSSKSAREALRCRK